MQMIFTAFIAAASLAAATASVGAGPVDSIAGSAIVGKSAEEVRPAYLAGPEPGYIVYSGYAGTLPAPSCYWTRMPVYDSDRNVIGWRGASVAVCP